MFVAFAFGLGVAVALVLGAVVAFGLGVGVASDLSVSLSAGVGVGVLSASPCVSVSSGDVSGSEVSSEEGVVSMVITFDATSALMSSLSFILSQPVYSQTLVRSLSFSPSILRVNSSRSSSVRSITSNSMVP